MFCPVLRPARIRPAAARALVLACLAILARPAAAQDCGCPGNPNGSGQTAPCTGMTLECPPGTLVPGSPLNGLAIHFANPGGEGGCTGTYNWRLCHNGQPVGDPAATPPETAPLEPGWYTVCVTFIPPSGDPQCACCTFQVDCNPPATVHIDIGCPAAGWLPTLTPDVMHASGSPPGGTCVWEVVSGLTLIHTNVQLPFANPWFEFATGAAGGTVMVRVTYGVGGCGATDTCIFQISPDSDGDGVPDIIDPDPAHPDADGDGYSDGCEMRLGTDPLHGGPNTPEHPNYVPDPTLDYDGDGVSDVHEVCDNHTDPHKYDTDNDGVPDLAEIELGLNPLAPVSDNQTPDALRQVWLDHDRDRDGAYDEWEEKIGLDPHNPDTDGDGVPDGWELRHGYDPRDPNSVPDIAHMDTDGDGLTDSEEMFQYHTDPLRADTDGDGMPDGWEVDKNNVYHPGLHLNPLDPSDANADPDGDGLSNLEEYRNETNPNNSDTDGDGVSDGEELAHFSDPTDPTDLGRPVPTQERREISIWSSGSVTASWAVWIGHREIVVPQASSPPIPHEYRVQCRVAASYTIHCTLLQRAAPAGSSFTCPGGSPFEGLGLLIEFAPGQPGVLEGHEQGLRILEDPNHMFPGGYLNGGVYSCLTGLQPTARIWIPGPYIYIDSDNTDGIEPPDRSAAEADAKWQLPGKLIAVSLGDADHDRIPDLADGMQPHPLGLNCGLSGSAHFVPIIIRVGRTTSLPDNLLLTIDYTDASDPAAIERFPIWGSPPGNPGDDWDYGFPNLLRLWTRSDAEMRDPRAVSAAHPGDYVPPGSYRIEDLHPDPAGLVHLWVEALDLSNIWCSIAVGTDVVAQPYGYAVYDRAVVTPVGLGIQDLQVWGAVVNADGSAGVSDTNLDLPNHGGLTLRYEGNGVHGAITDGSSVCLVRLWPHVTAPGASMVVRLIRPGAAYHDLPTVLGGFGGTPESGPALRLPPLPMPTDPRDLESLDYSCQVDFSGQKAFYVPPDNYTDPMFNSAAPVALNSQEVCPIDFELLVNGKPIGKFPFDLRRPPLLLVHGLMGKPTSWGPVWYEGSQMSQIQTRIYLANYEATNGKGYAENIGVIGRCVDQIVWEYRLGDRGDFDHDPARSFRGHRYAATRIDVAAHSMGGQVVRAYISDVHGYPPRGGQWPVMFFSTRQEDDPQGRWMYLRNNNFGAGDFRRFVPIGSPFNGSVLADWAESVFQPANAEFLEFIRARLPADVQAAAFDSNGNYNFPTAAVDLRTDSEARHQLEAANYPTGRKAVPWYPIVGIASNPIGDNPVQGTLWELLFNLMPGLDLIGDPGGLDDLQPTNSDLIVNQLSARNADEFGGPNSDLGEEPFTATIHMEIPGLGGWETETHSSLIQERVRRILSCPKTFFGRGEELKR